MSNDSLYRAAIDQLWFPPGHLCSPSHLRLWTVVVACLRIEELAPFIWHGLQVHYEDGRFDEPGEYYSVFSYLRAVYLGLPPDPIQLFLLAQCLDAPVAFVDGITGGVAVLKGTPDSKTPLQQCPFRFFSARGNGQIDVFSSACTIRSDYASYERLPAQLLGVLGFRVADCHRRVSNWFEPDQPSSSPVFAASFVHCCRSYMLAPSEALTPALRGEMPVSSRVLTDLDTTVTTEAGVPPSTVDSGDGGVPGSNSGSASPSGSVRVSIRNYL